MIELEALVREQRLAAYLAEHLGEGNLSVRRHQAGHSNETFFVDYGGRRYVLRRPPRGAFLPSAHDVGREYRVLFALQETPVRTPRPLLYCDDTEVIGAPFYLMEKIDGEVIRARLPAFLDGADERRRIGEELVDALAELHAVDYERLPLDGFGKPHGYLERQLRRWRGQLELTLPLTRPLPDLERIGEWLVDHRPESPRATLVHGDYKLDNVVYAPRAPARLVAILDWEMSTIGDPLADLGWMVSFWREHDDEVEERHLAQLGTVTQVPGFARRAELVERYERRSGIDARSLAWYQVLAIWKLAILLEGSYARHLAGATDDPFFAQMEHLVPALARRALALAS